MGNTFLNLTNKVLVRLNESPLIQDTFNDSRGIHSEVKQCVIDSINKINNSLYEWPFNFKEEEISLVIGQEEYDFPEDFLYADWRSFQIQPDDDLNIKSRTLKKIDRDDWYYYQRDRDTDQGNDGRELPRNVFKAPGNKFGVTPSPDKVYTLKYRYYCTPSQLENRDDTTTIPIHFDYVIVSGAIYYMRMFKADAELTMLAKTEFNENLNEMKTLLINRHEYLRDYQIVHRRSRSRFLYD